MAYKLLIINPGSTSTKIGVYEGEKEVLEEIYEMPFCIHRLNNQNICVYY